MEIGHNVGALYFDVFVWCSCLALLIKLAISWLSELDAPQLDQATPALDDLQDSISPIPSSLPVPSFYAVLRSNQLLRYLDDHIFQDFLLILDRISISKGESVYNLDQWGFCVVGSGEVEVRLVYDACDDDQQLTSTIFHRAREGDSLIPMRTMLGVLLEAMNADADPNMFSTLPAFSSSGSSKGRFEIIASQDVQLYATGRSRMREWISSQRQSSAHILEEILRRFFCMTAPLCITYLGLEKQWANFMMKLSATPLMTGQREVLQMASTTEWLRETLNDTRTGKNVGTISIVISGMESPHIPPSHSQHVGTERGNSMWVSQKKSLLPESNNTSTSRTFRGRVPLRLTISSLGKTQEGDRKGFSPLYKAENHSIPQKERLHYVANGKDNTFGSTLQQEIARQILRHLNGEGNFLLGNRKIWGDDLVDPLAKHYAEYVDIVYLAKEAVLVHQGSRYPGAILIIDGVASLRSPQNGTSDRNSAVTHATIRPTNVLGTECLLPENKSAFDVVAQTETFVGILPRAKVHELGAQHPLLVHYLGQCLFTNLSELLSLADFAMGWKHYHAGHAIPEHIKSESFSIVLHGKFRIRVPIDSGGYYVRDVPAGKSLGMPGMFVDNRKSREILCLRKSELANIQASAFEALALSEPRVALRVTRIFASNAAAAEGELIQRYLAVENDVASPKTIAILALSSSAPVEVFTTQLVKAIIDTGLKSAAAIAVLNSDRIINALGGGVFDNAGNVRLESYIDRVEENAEVTLLVADISPRSTWNKACIAHADSIILIGMADDDPQISEMDKTLLEVGTQSQIHLALIHEHSRSCLDGVTSAWLQPRSWIKGGRHHLRMYKNVSQLPSYDASTLKDPSSDFHRLSRRLFRRSVALILGGGGARGLAHVGFIKAMEERGIPVDIIGGSSMGACVGGVLARELTATSTYNCIKAFSRNLRIRHFLPDVTFPYLAKTTGSFFQRQLRDLFGNATFDDTWLEYYCAVTNVTKDCISQTVHQGNLSNSIAASMSYLGAVPPTCMNGDLWIDSCYSENLPARHARELGAETIFVVDVSRLEPLPLYRYGSSISGWNILISKMKNLLPARLHVPVSIPPSSSAISERLTLGTSTRESEAVKNMKGCYYVKLPLHGYTTKNFQKFEELVQQGYQGGKAWFDEQEALHNLPTLAVPHHITLGSEDIQNAAIDPRNSQASAEAQTL